jgi:hypothetical protein
VTTQFHHTHSDDNTVICTTDAESWMDLADTFFQFLRGVGYELKRQDLSDHFYEPVERTAEVEDEQEPTP